MYMFQAEQLQKLGQYLAKKKKLITSFMQSMKYQFYLS